MCQVVFNQNRSTIVNSSVGDVRSVVTVHRLVAESTEMGPPFLEEAKGRLCVGRHAGDEEGGQQGEQSKQQ